MPFLTPQTDSEPAVAVSITVPAVFFPAVSGALLELSLVENWEEYGNITPDEAAAIIAKSRQSMRVKEATLTTALIAAWELNESSGIRHDSHGEHHLTDNNTVTARAGKMGTNAAEFVRANVEYLSLADHANFDFSRDDYTFAFFVNLDDKIATQRFITKITTNFEMQIFYNLGADSYIHQVSTNGVSATHTLLASSHGSPTAGQWDFIIAQRNAATQKLGIQVNNGTLNEIALTENIYNGSGVFTLGGNSAPLDGALEQVFYWRKILTPEQKTWLYNGGNGRSYLDVLAHVE